MSVNTTELSKTDISWIPSSHRASTGKSHQDVVLVSTKNSAQQESISQKHEFCTEKTVTPEGTNVIRLTEAL